MNTEFPLFDTIPYKPFVKKCMDLVWVYSFMLTVIFLCQAVFESRWSGYHDCIFNNLST